MTTVSFHKIKYKIKYKAIFKAVTILTCVQNIYKRVILKKSNRNMMITKRLRFLAALNIIIVLMNSIFETSK